VMHHAACVAFLYGCFLYMFTSNVITARSRSFRMPVIVYAIAVTYIGVMLRAVLGSGEKLNLFSRVNVDLPIRPVDWPELFLSILWTTSSVDFILMCYRFDYAVTGAESDIVNEAAEFAMVKVHPVTEAIITEEEGALDAQPLLGVRVPSRLSTNFGKPYFYSAISAWIISNLLLIVLSSEYITLGGYESFGYCLGWMCLPLMFIGVFFAGLARGELKLLWKYTENWVVKPQAAVATPETLGLEHSGKESLLPMHEKGAL